MIELAIQEQHRRLGASYLDLSGHQAVARYGAENEEHAALTTTAGILDLSFRGRLCLTGEDRQRFLHGQVTNDVQALVEFTSLYAALVTEKGRLVTDLNLYRLPAELLLDFEPGLAARVAERLEKYVIADDVQIVDVSSSYGLLSVQGPLSALITEKIGVSSPPGPGRFVGMPSSAWGESYCMHQPRGAQPGFDLFIPTSALSGAWDELCAALNAVGGRPCGWNALETVRIEAGLPRFGADMDESNLAPETGIEERAISYTKGCYIGQEIIARIRTYGKVQRLLRGLVFPPGTTAVPSRGDVVRQKEHEVGTITSAVFSPTQGRPIALAYLRREHHQPGTAVEVVTTAGPLPALVSALPFRIPAGS